MTVAQLLGKINEFILNPIIYLALAVAMLVLFWGIFQFVTSETADTKREEGKKKIFFGILGLFIMIAAKGLMAVILNTFGISNSGTQYLGL